MGLSDNKRNVFTTIGAYTSLNKNKGQNKPRTKDTYSSVNNKNESAPFLLDVLKTVAGSEALKEVIGGLFTKSADSSEPKLKTSLKKQFTHSNSGDELPSSFKSDGITVPVSSVDSTNKYKVSPSSSDGALIYDTTNPNFDYSAHQAIVNSDTDVPYNNMYIRYNSSTDSFNIKPKIDGSSNPTIGEYFSTYIDNSQIINKKELVTNTMDTIYGTTSLRQKKTVEQLYIELQIQKKLEQALNGDDSFEISQNDYDKLLKKARELSGGLVYYDLGCGMMQAELPFDALNNLVSSVSGSTDPFAVGNAFEDTINASATDAETTAENQQTIKDNFFQMVIAVFTIGLLQAVTTSPQIRVLLAIMGAFENNGTPNTGKANDDMKDSKTTVNCLAKEVNSIVLEFIFELAVVYLMKLLTPIIKDIIKEKINQYVGIIKSLTSTG